MAITFRRASTQQKEILNKNLKREKRRKKKKSSCMSKDNKKPGPDKPWVTATNSNETRTIHRYNYLKHDSFFDKMTAYHRN